MQLKVINNPGSKGLVRVHWIKKARGTESIHSQSSTQTTDNKLIIIHELLI